MSSFRGSGSPIAAIRAWVVVKNPWEKNSWQCHSAHSDESKKTQQTLFCQRRLDRPASTWFFCIPLNRSVDDAGSPSLPQSRDGLSPSAASSEMHSHVMAFLSTSDNISSLALTHRRKSCGRGRVPEFWAGDVNVRCPSRVCLVSKFQAPDCLHYSARQYSSEFTKTQHFKGKIHFFPGEGPNPLPKGLAPHQIHLGEGYSLPTPPTLTPRPSPSLLDPTVGPPEFQPNHTPLLDITFEQPGH